MVARNVRRPDFETIVHMLDEGVIVIEHTGRVKYVNPAAVRIYGFEYPLDAAELFTELASAQCYYVDGTRVPTEIHPVALAFRRGHFSREIYGVDLPNGERRWLLTSGGLIDPDDPLSDLLVSFSDITAQRHDLDSLIHQAHHDPLTGLPNRTVVLRRIAEALASTGRRSLCAVLFIDLDDLKTTNDTMGHDAGDELLKAAAVRLRQSVGPADVVARHGGDEFVILLHGEITRRELDEWLSRLLDRLAEPADIGTAQVSIRASVGVVEVDRDDARRAEEILRDADIAMYKAKRARHRSVL